MRIVNVKQTQTWRFSIYSQDTWWKVTILQWLKFDKSNLQEIEKYISELYDEIEKLPIENWQRWKAHREKLLTGKNLHTYLIWKYNEKYWIEEDFDDCNFDEIEQGSEIVN